MPKLLLASPAQTAMLTRRCALLAVFFLATGLHAQEEPETAEELKSPTPDQLVALHGLVDANGDGKVSQHELIMFSQNTSREASLKDAASILDEMDTNEDGKLSFEELEPEGSSEFLDHEQQREMFAIADGNRDGFLDDQELTGYFNPEHNEQVLTFQVKHAFKVMDLDADGEISSTEFWQKDVPAGDRSFTALDTDGNGKLNFDEVIGWQSNLHYTNATMKQLIAHTDNDSDGVLTVNEIASAWKSLPNTDARLHLSEWARHHEL